MRPSLRNGLLLAAAAVVALAGGYWTAQTVRKSEISTDAAAPADFTLPDLDGRPRQLSEWRGRVVVVNFWATWCPPCREEIPVFIAMQRRYGARGLQIVGVAIDRKSDVVAYRDAMRINYPILLGPEAGLTLMRAYGDRLSTLPYSVILDRQGRVVARKLGAYTAPGLEKALAPLLTRG